MLKQVEAILKDRGWLDARRSYDKTILLSKGNTVAILFSGRARPHLYVKFSVSACLCDEAARWSAAHTSYPWLTPCLIGNVHQPGLDLLVCEAIPHTPVGRVSLLTGTSGDVLRRDVIRYFSCMRTARAPEHPRYQSPDRLVESMRDYFGRLPTAASVLPMLGNNFVDLLTALPLMPQHGDLVLNNLGRAQRRLVLFDWEDFGLLQQPGADLCTLLLSLGVGGSARTADLRIVHRALPGLVEEACTAMGLSVTNFELLFPVYVLAFRFLKRTYDVEVRERLDHLIRELRDPFEASLVQSSR